MILKLKISLVAVTLPVMVACSAALLSSARIGLNVSRPFVQQLVIERVIPQEKADIVISDVSDGLDKADACDRCLKAIKETGKAKKVAKGQCYFQLAQDWRAILQRNNIGGVPQLDRVANIIQAGISALEEYFRAVNSADAPPGMKSVSDVKRAEETDPDKDLEKALKRMRDDLKDATKTKG